MKKFQSIELKDSGPFSSGNNKTSKHNRMNLMRSRLVGNIDLFINMIRFDVD